MKVAFYYPWIYLKSGGERIIVELTRRSRHDWTLFTSHYEPQNTFPELSDRKVIELPRVPVERDIVSSARAACRIMTQKLPMEDYDALFVLCEGLGDLILYRNHSKPSLCYCLTPLRAAFDPFYRAKSYEQRGFLGKAALTAGMSVFRYMDSRAWRHYTSVLFLSKESLRRAQSAGLVSSAQNEILYTGIGLVSERPSELQERFFLIPGRIMWTKNLELGIGAFRLFREQHPEFGDMRLVISGMVDEKSKPYLAGLKKLAGGDSRIDFRLNPSDAELKKLYATCHTVLFTPLNEDLGIVPLEAMAFGKPILAVNNGGPKETVENGVQGFLLDPQPESFAEKMADLVTNPTLTARMGAAGFERSRLFTWDHFVGRIDDILDEIVAARGKRPALECRLPSEEEFRAR